MHFKGNDIHFASKTGVKCHQLYLIRQILVREYASFTRKLISQSMAARLIFTALQGIQSGLAMRILSVRPFVSLANALFVTKRKNDVSDFFYTIRYIRKIT